MICEKILGKLTDGEFSGKKVDYVDIHWDEAFKKLHRKTSQGGTELGIRLDDSVLTRGLNQDDVLAVEGDTVYAVNIPPCEVIVVTVDEHHPHMVAKVCYEIGNRHAPLFWGAKEGTFITPYNHIILATAVGIENSSSIPVIRFILFGNSRCPIPQAAAGIAI